MKISELIALLGRLKVELGDVNCVVHDTDYSRDEDITLHEVQFDHEDKVLRFMP